MPESREALKLLLGWKKIFMPVHPKDRSDILTSSLLYGRASLALFMLLGPAEFGTEQSPLLHPIAQGVSLSKGIKRLECVTSGRRWELTSFQPSGSIAQHRFPCPLPGV